MPLIHSKKPAAFKENIREMVHSGHPVKQAVAAAYSIKRAAEHKKHMAEGGETAANEKEPMLIGPEAEEPEGMEPDSEMHDMVGQELMDAIHSKDHKKLMEGIEAAILQCMNKKED